MAINKQSAIQNLREIAENRRLGIINHLDFINTLANLKSEYVLLLGDKSDWYIFHYADDLKIKDEWEPFRLYPFMTRDEQEELILDNIVELYPEKEYGKVMVKGKTLEGVLLVSRKNPTNKQKAINDILKLAKDRKDNKISLQDFVYKLCNVEPTNHTHLGREYLLYVHAFAADIDSQNSIDGRNFDKEMSIHEEEQLILNNILKLFSVNKQKIENKYDTSYFRVTYH